MGRPFKNGIDYYAHNIGMYEDEKFLDIREKYGLLGLGIITKLLEDIYKNGYFLKWTDKIERNFCLTNHIDIEIVKFCIRSLTGIGDTYATSEENHYFFDRRLYKDNRILTSKSIQRFYIFACARRKKIVIDRSCFLLDISQETEQEKQERLASKQAKCKDACRLLYTTQDGRKSYLDPIKAGLITACEETSDLPNPSKEEFQIDYDILYDENYIENQVENIYVDINPENADINSQRGQPDVNISAQSKVKESKVKEIESKFSYAQNETSTLIPEKKESESPFKFKGFQRLIDRLNQKAGKSYSLLLTPHPILCVIDSLFRKGQTEDDFNYVIDVMCEEWKDKKNSQGQPMANFLTLKTLFGPGYQDYRNKKFPETKKSVDLDKVFREYEKRKQQEAQDDEI